PKVLTQDSTQGGGSWNVERASLPEGCANTLAGWKPPGDEYINMLLTDAESEGVDRANSAKHRGAFRPDEIGRQVTSARYQTYCHARASTITTKTIIKLISAHKLSVRLSPLLSLCIVTTSLQDAEGAHDSKKH